MNLKKIAVLSTLVSSLSLATVGAALADNPTPTPNATAVARGTERLSDVQAKADRLISQRVDVVNKLISRLNSDTHLIDSDKTLLMNEDQAALSSLNSLKAKIDADTTVADARNDEAQLATIHIYDFVAPHNQRLIVVDNLMALAAKEGTLLTTIQAKVTNLQNQGNDMSAIQTLLTDANNKLLAINGQLVIDQRGLTALTSGSGASTIASTFAGVRQDFTTIRSNFTGIRSDLVKIKADAQAMKKSATPAPTATP